MRLLTTVILLFISISVFSQQSDLERKIGVTLLTINADTGYSTKAKVKINNIDSIVNVFVFGTIQIHKYDGNCIHDIAGLLFYYDAQKKNRITTLIECYKKPN